MESSLAGGQRTLSVSLTHSQPLDISDDAKLLQLSHSRVSAWVMRGGEIVDSIGLEPILDADGQIYGGHLSLPSLDSLNLVISFTKPLDVAMDSSDVARLPDTPQVVEFSGIKGADTSAGGTLFLTNGFSAGWRMGAPETLWVWEDTCCIAKSPEGGYTHFLRVDLRDYSAESNAFFLPYARIRGRLFFEGRSGNSREFAMEPFQGQLGYYYWTVFSPP
jgi:hypothetical protein